MGIKNKILLKKKQHDTPYLSFSHPWTRETRSNDFWVFSKMADHSLIPRSSPLFKMAVESNFPPSDHCGCQNPRPRALYEV